MTQDAKQLKRIQEGYKPIKANHYDVKVTVSDRDVAKVKKIIHQNYLMLY